jgi:Cu+-exporting ATPase
VWLGVIPTALLMLGEWVFGWHTQPWFRWTSFLLALMVQAGPGVHFYRGAWRQLKIGGSNMDTLVSLGSTTAFAYSAWVLFSGQQAHLYFMEAAAIITLISLGHLMEARVSAHASAGAKPMAARARRPWPICAARTWWCSDPATACRQTDR